MPKTADIFSNKTLLFIKCEQCMLNKIVQYADIVYKNISYSDMDYNIDNYVTMY